MELYSQCISWNQLKDLPVHNAGNLGVKDGDGMPLGTQYHDVIVPPYHCAITVIVISSEASIKHFYTDFQPGWTCLIASPFMLCHDAVFGSLGWPLTGGQIFC